MFADMVLEYMQHLPQIIFKIAIVLYSLHSLDFAKSEEDTCGQYKSFLEIMHKCRRHKQANIVIPELIAGYSNGLIELTETELEKDLAAYCRNITPMYAKCIEKSAAMQNCHSSQYIFDIKELTTDWLSIYCNNDDISDWLKEYLRHGFRYKNTCGRNDICYTCFFDLVYNRDEHIFTGENIKDYNIWAKSLTADWFACTKEKLPLTQASFPDCTSSWQDVLFLTFLYESARFNSGLRLYQDQMTQILNLKTASSIPLK